MSPVTNYFAHARQTCNTRTPQTSHRCPAQSPAHPGSGQTGLPPLGASASLDDIATQSGVGPGTLYRHFRARDALIEAVYRAEVEKLAAAAQDFAKTMPPLEALRAWMLLFVDHIAAKQIIASALNSVVGGPSKLYQGSRGQIRERLKRWSSAPSAAAICAAISTPSI
jgi:AcrR family transcriptional regulator